MKKLHLFLIKAYMGPFIVTFFIALFFLMMQFLWKYIDDLMGKGLETSVVLKLLFYVSFNLVPMALPLAIMVSSIMTMGALGESNELTALKSSGISLFRIMRPLILFVAFISIGAFFFANYAWPWSNLKWKALYFEIKDKKPAFAIKEKAFYNDIPNFSIRVEKKNDKGNKFDDILIYDYSGTNSYRKRDVRAASGELQKSTNADYLLLSLHNGHIYEEVRGSNMFTGVEPFCKTSFAEAQIKFDVSHFKMGKGNEDLFKDSYEMLNIYQLQEVTDSLVKTKELRKDDYALNLMRRHLIYRPVMKARNEPKTEKNDSIKKTVTVQVPMDPVSPQLYGNNKYTTAIQLCDQSVKLLENSINEMLSREDNINRYNIEWHRKFTLSLACLIIFFIGAPLGAIVKKGGLGTPMVISVILFLIYHVITITGEKMAKTGTLTPFWGMWLSAFILAPLGLFLTYQAAREHNLDFKAYFSKPFTYIWRQFKRLNPIASRK